MVVGALLQDPFPSTSVSHSCCSSAWSHPDGIVKQELELARIASDREDPNPWTGQWRLIDWRFADQCLYQVSCYSASLSRPYSGCRMISMIAECKGLMTFFFLDSKANKQHKFSWCIWILYHDRSSIKCILTQSSFGIQLFPFLVIFRISKRLRKSRNKHWHT